MTFRPAKPGQTGLFCSLIGSVKFTSLAVVATAWLTLGSTPAHAQDSNSQDQADRGAQDAELSGDDHPYERRIQFPVDFPADGEWLNTGGSIRLRDLRGKFVLLDFWTYCCINCIHILPELKKLEQKYPDELVVIGVHSAKFETEKDAKNIKEAILRYEIEHPVLNDAEHLFWNQLGIRSWPTLIMIDPEGMAIFYQGGEVPFEVLDDVISRGLPYYREKGTLDETPIQFELHAFAQPDSPLLFPGKVLADEASDRLFIADSNHNRIVVTTLDGELIDTIGTGSIGSTDGGYNEAQFDHPQGMVLDGNRLLVADTENHMIRSVDLESRQVSTIAGVGTQGRVAFPGLDKLSPLDDLPDRWVGDPKTTALNSPWALWVHDDELYIAMAGPHQIWKMSADGKEIGPYAGNGREDIVDGPLVPQQPYEMGYSSFAQPSGLASDGTWLYVADSEGSSIRAVPFDPTDEVRTVVGTNELPFNRLFAFGDQDGERDDVLLQHPLGVVYFEGQLYITDTYNNKVKIVDAATGDTRTLAGTGKPGNSDAEGTFDEPAGLSLAGDRLYIADTNNHAIRIVHRETGAVSTLEIAGLTSPTAHEKPQRRTLDDAAEGKVLNRVARAVDGHAVLKAKIDLPEGWKINDLAPMSYTLIDETFEGVVDNSALADDATRFAKPSDEFTVNVPVLRGTGSDEVTLQVVFYYCQEGGEGLCRVGAVTWKIPFDVTNDSDAEAILLEHSVAE